MNRASDHWSLTWTEAEPQLMMEIAEQEQSHREKPRQEKPSEIVSLIYC